MATARQKWGYGGYADVLRTRGGVANRVASNVAQPELVQPGKWHCVEYYAKLSQPGRDNGRLKLWVRGKLVCDLPGLPLVDRKHAGILLNHWMFGPYFHGGSHKEQFNYLDALVIATEYVGTFEQQGNQPPRARLTHTRDWGRMTARFDAAASADPDGTIAEFAWDFGDGRTASGRSVEHAYRRLGDYLVKLTVVDRQGESHQARLPIAVAQNVGSGNGLRAEYYRGQQFEGRPVVRTERQIDFRRQGWAGRFLRGEVGDPRGDHYCCRWTGLRMSTCLADRPGALRLRGKSTLSMEPDSEIGLDLWCGVWEIDGGGVEINVGDLEFWGNKFQDATNAKAGERVGAGLAVLKLTGDGVSTIHARAVDFVDAAVLDVSGLKTPAGTYMVIDGKSLKGKALRFAAGTDTDRWRLRFDEARADLLLERTP